MGVRLCSMMEIVRWAGVGVRVRGIYLCDFVSQVWVGFLHVEFLFGGVDEWEEIVSKLEVGWSGVKREGGISSILIGLLGADRI